MYVCSMQCMYMVYENDCCKVALLGRNSQDCGMEYMLFIPNKQQVGGVGVDTICGFVSWLF